MINYNKLISLNPTSFGTMVNTKGQDIEFYEHPIEGDMAPVIVACHSLKLADHSEFFETDDMKANKDYSPIFQDGKLIYQYEL